MNNPFEMYTQMGQQMLEQWNQMMKQTPSAGSLPGSELMSKQTEFWTQQWQLWQGLMSSGLKGKMPEVVKSDAADKRFSAEEWSKYPFFDFIKQSYLLTSRFYLDTAANAKLSDEYQKRLNFVMKQYVDAMSPSNFAATNPEVIAMTLESGGENLRKGMENLMEDMKIGHIQMTNEAEFEVGRNVAVTPGKVVFQNEIFQLIQYTPQTAEVYERPILMVPPCINKYYLMDLQPSNSLVSYTVSQGQTVYMVSWRNVGPEQGKLSVDDYVEDGVIQAIEVVRDISGQKKINVLGFCIGGALLSCALAVLKKRRKDIIQTSTFLATMLDYSDPGEIMVYLTDQFLESREPGFLAGELMSGHDLGTAFATLRANELIWFFVINNYLKGKTPASFDLLYWNSDSTNLPGVFYAYYIRHFYMENALREPDKLSLCGQRINLSRVDMPMYFLASREDHIVPWKTAYKSLDIMGGQDKTFVLAASGHIAGVINPPTGNRRNYWLGGNQEAEATQWFDSATEVPGSWWPHWVQWLSPASGKKIPAPTQFGNDTYTPTEDAPGSYVKVRLSPARQKKAQ